MVLKRATQRDYATFTLFGTCASGTNNWWSRAATVHQEFTLQCRDIRRVQVLGWFGPMWQVRTRHRRQREDPDVSSTTPQVDGGTRPEAEEASHESVIKRVLNWLDRWVSQGCSADRAVRADRAAASHAYCRRGAAGHRRAYRRAFSGPRGRRDHRGRDPRHDRERDRGCAQRRGPPEGVCATSGRRLATRAAGSGRPKSALQ